ncbi:ABC transporter permease subunit [Streptomyces sp. NPDC059853]|uniref:ABC transporter permease subunit n=1 Tax=Streptomyces sp. NPDC059853 TaxID=3346973 RepID=UPI00366741FB
MPSPNTELFLRVAHVQRRTVIAWSAALVLLAWSVIGVWPSMESSGSLDDFSNGLSPDLAAAFGLDQFNTAAGYLKGNLYAVLLPLLLGLMAVTATGALTAGDEESGRLELLLALPVRRRSVYLLRFAVATAVLAVAGVLVWAAVLSSVIALDMDVSASGVTAASLAVWLLAVLHAAVTYAAAGFGLPRAASLGTAAAVLVVGYLLHAIAPLADALEPVSVLSPWEWALGSDPLTTGFSLTGPLALLLVSAALVAAGTVGIERRDIKNA